MSATATRTFANYVGGDFVETPETFEDRNPAAPDDVVGAFPRSGPDEVAAAVGAAQRALPGWRETPAVARGRWLTSLAAALRSRADELAAAITREQGKSLA